MLLTAFVQNFVTGAWKNRAIFFHQFLNLVFKLKKVNITDTLVAKVNNSLITEDGDVEEAILFVL